MGLDGPSRKELPLEEKRTFLNSNTGTPATPPTVNWLKQTLRTLQSGPVIAQFIFIMFAILASYSTYFCMYAFRKPYSAGLFTDLKFWGIEFKTALVISQTVGYMLAKYAGIKFCSEITPQRRAPTLIFLILSAQVSLILLAILPQNLKVYALFLNGLSLGMIWGLVVWYLEGRQTSEILLAGLSCSFIMASGVVKDLGLLVQNQLGVSEWWMPAATGAFFLVPFFGSVWLLNQLPQPTKRDEKARVEREPMGHKVRLKFLKTFLPGLAFLFIVYFFVTAFRDFRDNFMRDLFLELGYEGKPAVMSQTDTIVAFGVIISLGLLNLIKNNRWGLLGVYAVMIGGLTLTGVSTLLFNSKQIDGFWWITLTGLGTYLTYVPYGSVFFDRLMASTRFVGTAVFAIYVADALGYTGVVGVLLYKDLGQAEMSKVGFYQNFSYLLTAMGVVLLLASCFYFDRKARKAE